MSHRTSITFLPSNAVGGGIGLLGGGAPVVAGVAFPGRVLSSGRTGQWSADGVPLAGQTGASYTLRLADMGKAIRQDNSLPRTVWKPSDVPGVGGVWCAFNGMLNAGAAAPAYLDQIATVQDLLSGNSAHATQATGSLRPLALPCPEGSPHYLHLPGVVGNYASVPDANALDITGDITIECKVAALNWIPGASAGYLVAKLGDFASQVSYGFYLNTDGKLGVILSAGGTTSTQVNSTVAVGFAAKSVNWVSVRWRASDGRTQFFTSGDGVTWVQLGTDVTLAVGGIFAGTSPVEFGSRSNGTNIFFSGQYFQARIYADITRADKRLDIDFSGVAHGAASFVCGTGQTVTVSSTGANPTTVIGTSVLLFDGVDDLMTMGGTALAIYQNKGYGSLLASARDTNRLAGSAGHVIGFWSLNGSTATRFSMLSRDLSLGNNYVAGARRVTGDAFAGAVSASSANYVTLTNETLFASGAVNLRVNGSQTGTASLPGSGVTENTASLGASIGAAADSTNYFGGHWGGTIAWSGGSALSAANRLKLEAFVALLHGDTTLAATIP